MEILDAELVDPPTHMVPTTDLAVRPPRATIVVTAFRPGPEGSSVRRQAGLALARFLFRTLPGDILRGFATWVRGWWRWMMLSAQTEAARAEGKASMGEDKRIQERKLRVLQSLILAFTATVAVLLFWWLAAPAFTATVYWYLRAVGVVVLLGWFATGHQWRGSGVGDPGHRVGWDGTVASLRGCFTSARIIKDDQAIYLVGRPTRVGMGWEVVVDLPAGVTWEDIRKKLAALASAMLVSSEFMVVEQGDHDAQAKLWIPAGNPFAGGAERSPLMEVEQWDSWEPAPFGRAPNGAEIELRLMYSNYLGSGQPGAGKSFTARNIVAPYILDPDARMFVANGKGDQAWEAVRDLSVEYIRGARPDECWRLNNLLDQVIAEMEDRYQHKLAGSKLTRTDGLPAWLVVVDELQQYTICPEATTETVWGKKNAPLGLVIAAKLTDIAKQGRAGGIILMLLTQKPSDKSLPLELRDQIGMRFANKVTNRHVSEMVLGKSPADGVDASKIGTKYKGLGILIPDGEESPIEGYPLVRPYLITDEDWQELGARGRDLRRGGAGRVEYQVPDLLAAILEDVADQPDHVRVSSVDLRERLAPPDMTQTAFGLRLRQWGAPTGRDPGNKGPSGPVVGDLRKVGKRIRDGGRVDLLKSA